MIVEITMPEKQDTPVINPTEVHRDDDLMHAPPMYPEINFDKMEEGLLAAEAGQSALEDAAKARLYRAELGYDDRAKTVPHTFDARRGTGPETHFERIGKSPDTGPDTFDARELAHKDVTSVMSRAAILAAAQGPDSRVAGQISPHLQPIISAPADQADKLTGSFAPFAEQKTSGRQVDKYAPDGVFGTYDRGIKPR